MTVDGWQVAPDGVFAAGQLVELGPRSGLIESIGGPGFPPTVGLIVAVDLARPDRRPYLLDTGRRTVWIPGYYIRYVLATCRPEETDGSAGSQM